ncbi:G-box-binding factor-like [Anopheles aquasalis]|uniref:G-box-binding factor-like n=1 Tax=Anopheles aquasalis TaxID=42839 RepID=UPI00215B6BE7|nr:G-box-binding factor-like [Anopheles aquasalis]
MYNQSYNNTYGVGAGFYGQEYHQQYYYQQHHQQQQQQQKQQMLAGVMSYYPAPESMAMVFNQYQQGPMQSMHPQQAAYQYQQQQQQHQLDYQMTPALYLLNQQAELLQRSLSKPASSSSSKSKRSNTSGNGGKVSRKVRGPYQNKTLSPTPSPAAHKITPETDRLSVSSDLSCSVAQQLSMTPPPTMVEPHNAVNAATQQQTKKQKRKSDSFLEYERQATVKQAKFDHSQESAATATTTTITTGTLSPVVPTVSPKQVTSIFRNVALMAESSCNRH